jgi:adenylate cyclase
MRTSPHDPLTWLWMLWSAMFHFYSRQFDAAIQKYQHVLRLRPAFVQSKVTMAAALAHLGRLDEAHELLKQARAQSSLDPRYQQPPWTRPEDNALRIEGIRLAAGEIK